MDSAVESTHVPNHHGIHMFLGAHEHWRKPYIEESIQIPTAGHISAFERVLYTEDFQKRVGFAVFKKQFCHENVCQEAV